MHQYISLTHSFLKGFHNLIEDYELKLENWLNKLNHKFPITQFKYNNKFLLYGYTYHLFPLCFFTYYYILFTTAHAL
jgi:hypothetical protein